MAVIEFVDRDIEAKKIYKNKTEDKDKQINTDQKTA